MLLHSCPGTRSGYLHCCSASLTSLPQPNHISVICFSSLSKFYTFGQVDQLMWKPTTQPSPSDGRGRKKATLLPLAAKSVLLFRNHWLSSYTNLKFLFVIKSLLGLKKAICMGQKFPISSVKPRVWRCFGFGLFFFGWLFLLLLVEGAITI